MMDIHAHVLPGVDDGAANIHMSRAMMRRAVSMGVTDIVATPHVYEPEDQERNLSAWPDALNNAREAGLTLYMGCELNYRALTRTGTRELEKYCLAGTPCLLLELPAGGLMPGWEALLCELGENGYSLIIAHPERYAYIQRDLGVAQEMLDYGCELQVDAGSLFSGMLNMEQRTARRLLRMGLVSYIASDAHRPEDYAVLDKALWRFRDEWSAKNRLTSFLREQRQGKPHLR